MAVPLLADQEAAALQEMEAFVDSLDEAQKKTFQVLHAGFPSAALLRFLKAREFDPTKASKMLKDCLNWRIKNDVDSILCRPVDSEQYEKIRASQLYGMTGFDKEGRPVLSVRVGLSSQDPSCKLEEYLHSHIQHNEYRDRVLLPEACKRMGRPVTSCVKIYDMTGLKLTQLHRMTMHKAVAGVDDLNYPEKAEVYYIVNAPLVFSAAWKAVRPMLQDRTRRKVQVLPGSGFDYLLQTMDESVLPHFVRYAPKDGLGSSKNIAALNNHPKLVDNPEANCSSTRHVYHVKMQEYIQAQAAAAKALGVEASTSRATEVAIDDIVGELTAGEGGAELDVAAIVEKTLAEVALEGGQ